MERNTQNTVEKLSESKMSIYQEKGFDDRQDYIESLANEYGTSIEVINCISDGLGKIEDFDGLLSTLDDFSYADLLSLS